MTLNESKLFSREKNGFSFALAVLSLILGISLLSINLYGLTQSIRKPGLGVNDHDQLRFIPEEVWSYEKSMDAIGNLSTVKPGDDLAEQANRIVNQSLVHVEWNRVDALEYRQLVPIWENYFLYLLGRYSELPQFTRYHYADYQRNIRRGIGICGDASTILSSVLDQHDVSNQIIAFRGHVLVEYTGTDGQDYLMDPDFGVSLGVDLESLVGDPQIVRSRYIDAGYSSREVDSLFESYATKYNIFDDTYQFMKQRYLFERFSYVMKWLLPIMLIVASVLRLNKSRRTS